MSTFARLVAGAAIAAALTVGFAETSYAGPVNGGFTTNSIPRNDDGSAAGAVALPFTAGHAPYFDWITAMTDRR